ncbi:hypothetical protein CMUS01_11041 [Colletotrichum musicola]|uniref:Uncharacterized protein n=1 Tax=Colletotrichum musicola TaxID=2175873 RepID=A0A8H6K1J8_9PEZI|nr:hypothetical protein CMUS01_11041 [Colletotrichum musicola]
MVSPKSEGPSRPSLSISAMQPKNRETKVNSRSPAARYNQKVLRSLEKELARDAEADITNLLSKYSSTLRSFASFATSQSISTPGTSDSKPYYPDGDIRSRHDIAVSSTIVSELSDELDGLFQPYEDLSAGLVSLLAKSEVIYESSWTASVMVFRLSDDIVVKVTSDESFALTEHQSLCYLQKHLPDFPAPKPHGVICHDIFYFLFTSFIPGVTLETMWPQLDNFEKQNISSQLETLLSKLRSHFPTQITLR